jgi:aldose sugar dehydrogenase
MHECILKITNSYIPPSMDTVIMYQIIFFILNFLIIVLSLISVSNYASSIKSKMPIIQDGNLAIETVYKGLRFPTTMAFLGPGDILVLEKNEGTVQRLVNGAILSNPLLDVKVSPIEERGMLGIAIENNKSESESSTVFLYYTRPENQSMPHGTTAASNYVYKFELVNNKLVNPKILLHLPILSEGQHNGGVILIGPDDNIYLMTGDGLEYNGTKPKTQNYKNGSDADGIGGILRITQEGQPTNKDGILGLSMPLRLYYAYGIRNSFGMDFDPVSGKLWDTENGAGSGDEINLVTPAFNSGSIKVQGLASLHKGFSESDLESFNGKGQYSDPEFTWNATVGVTALKFMDSDKLGKGYENDMFVGDFHNGYLYHFDLNKNRTALSTTGPLEDKIANNNDELKDAILGEGFGGITDIKVGPDGYLYILSLKQGGDNCINEKKSSDCVNYESEILGTIYKIVPKQNIN